MKHRISLRVGDVSSSHGDGYVRIEMEDAISGVHFLDIEMSYADFGRLVKSAGSVKVEADIRNTEHIGKKHVLERRSVVCHEKFDDVPYRNKRAAQEQWLRDNCQEEGWHLSSYLGSQDSIKSNFKDGTETFNYHVYKYVDIAEEERQEILRRGY